MSKIKVLCAHGYTLMHDSCPGCDWESERPHTADMVKVAPAWSDTPHLRCRRCSQVGAHRVHRFHR